MKKVLLLILLSIFAISLSGCASMKKKNKGALIGGTAGAILGGVIGERTGNTALGAIIGAAVGGAAGAYIGNYMDKQAEEIERDLEGATVERVGEGIKITFASGILFDVNSSNLQDAAKTNLRNLSVILNKYQDTEILVEGHTDSDGTDEHNRDLSIRRAQSVATDITGNNVIPTRFTIMGYGEAQPVADNTTDMGKQSNRRVEIAIFANDKLKSVAEDKAINDY
jgi:outer membrane protein OmpA-like peptidoglycan-associated protein